MNIVFLLPFFGRNRSVQSDPENLFLSLYPWEKLTSVAKVLRQNVRSFSGHLKATSASEKQLLRLRILCLFLLESSEEIYERPKKLVCTERVCRSAWTQCLFIFDLLESISHEWKTIGYGQNLTPFPNMDSEIGSLFLFERSEGIFEEPIKLVSIVTKKGFC